MRIPKMDGLYIYICIYETNNIPLKWMIFWGMPNAYVRTPAYSINANICQHASNTKGEARVGESSRDPLSDVFLAKGVFG